MESILKNIGIDQETITALDRLDDLFVADGTGNDTIEANRLFDEIFDVRDFGETPPLDLTYEFDDVDGRGETPPVDMEYILDAGL